MTNILIPTDFTSNSLKLAELAVKSLENGQVNIVLFHAFSMPFFMQDIIRGSINEPYRELVTDPFRYACKQLKDKHPKKIGKIMFRFMTGDSINLFKNFIDANDIDMIICPDDYKYVKVHERSINPLPFFRKAGIPLIKDLMPVKQEIVFKVRKQAEEEFAVN